MIDAVRLKELYMHTSKHSNYQILNEEISGLIDVSNDIFISTYEKERFWYITNKLSLDKKVVLDIGGNTGYFSFESIKKGCEKVEYYEGNKEHSEFVKCASAIYGEQMIDIHPEYYMFETDGLKADVAFCLNVVHHLGDDFGDGEKKYDAKNKMLQCINNLAFIAEKMVFQMGYNWKGDRNECLFVHGTKNEMIEYIKEGTKEFWSIENIGVAERLGKKIIYADLNDVNIERDDSLGEFLNRPLFIMSSLKYKSR